MDPSKQSQHSPQPQQSTSSFGCGGCSGGSSPSQIDSPARRSTPTRRVTHHSLLPPDDAETHNSTNSSASNSPKTPNISNPNSPIPSDSKRDYSSSPSLNSSGSSSNSKSSSRHRSKSISVTKSGSREVVESSDSGGGSKRTTPKERKSRRNETWFQNEIIDEYVIPFHVFAFDQQKVSEIACDSSIVALSEQGRLFVWGGTQLDSGETTDLLNTRNGSSSSGSTFSLPDPDILVSSNAILTSLGDNGVLKINSSGSELVAISKS